MVYLYCITLVSGIPVWAIIIRYNLVQVRATARRVCAHARMHTHTYASWVMLLLRVASSRRPALDLTRGTESVLGDDVRHCAGAN